MNAASLDSADSPRTAPARRCHPEAGGDFPGAIFPWPRPPLGEGPGAGGPLGRFPFKSGASGLLPRPEKWIKSGGRDERVSRRPIRAAGFPREIRISRHVVWRLKKKREEEAGRGRAGRPSGPSRPIRLHPRPAGPGASREPRSGSAGAPGSSSRRSWPGGRPGEEPRPGARSRPPSLPPAGATAETPRGRAPPSAGPFLPARLLSAALRRQLPSHRSSEGGGGGSRRPVKRPAPPPP